MPNPYFRFKQFTVFHDQCAMKVGTDGVLLGAWTDCRDAKKILDVGTGSGLIALMLAQRSHASVCGIDIDENACKQAQLNVSHSPFAEQIEIRHCDYAAFTAHETYDLIVSNPPYFIHSLKSPGKTRSIARHNDALAVDTLLTKSLSVLSPTGKIALILPYEQREKTDSIASGIGLTKRRETMVKPLPDTPPKRILLEYSRQLSVSESSTLCIELSRHHYSEEYRALTKNFYLNL